MHNLIAKVYDRSKTNPEIHQKMCTHGKSIIEGWKKYTIKPQGGLDKGQWRSILGRGIIHVFNDGADPIALLNIHIKNQPVITFDINEQRGAFFLYADFNVLDTIGEKYIDREYSGEGRRRKGAEKEDSYQKEDLTHIRVIYDITPLIKAMEDRSHSGEKSIEIIPEASESMVKITSICPQG